MLSGIKTAGKWIVAIGAALGILILALLGYGRRRAKEGIAIGEIREERERLDDAVRRGDDAAVEEEWRRSRKP